MMEPAIHWGDFLFLSKVIKQLFYYNFRLAEMAYW